MGSAPSTSSGRRRPPPPSHRPVAAGQPAARGLRQELHDAKQKLHKLQRVLRTIELYATPAPPAECVICMDAPVETVLVPCCHACACADCASLLMVLNNGTCPVCRVAVEGAPRIFLPTARRADKATEGKRGGLGRPSTPADLCVTIG